MKNSRRHAIIGLASSVFAATHFGCANVDAKKGGKNTSCQGVCSPDNPASSCECICRKVPRSKNANNYSRQWGLCIKDGQLVGDDAHPDDCCTHLYCSSTDRCGFC